MEESKNEYESGEDWKEILRLISALFLIALFITVLIGLPLLAGHYWHPWIGVGLSIAALPAWIYLGPPPMPGFVNGILCINGLLLLMGMVVINILQAVASG